MIGQRLYTGRVAVAQAALAFRRQVFEVTEAYAKQKPIPDVAGRKGRVLADIPQLRALFDDAAARAYDGAMVRRTLNFPGEPPRADVLAALPPPPSTRVVASQEVGRMRRPPHALPRVRPSVYIQYTVSIWTYAPRAAAAGRGADGWTIHITIRIQYWSY